jgi:uncharacterized membrane protein
MKWKDSFHPYAAITIFFWSLAYVFTKLALRYFSPFSLGFLRYVVASLALIAVAVVTKMRLPQKRDVWWFMASGATGFFFYMIAFNKGQNMVTASTGSVVLATVPVITALLARNPDILCCDPGNRLQRHCLCVMVKGICESKTDVTSQQLYVFNSFFNKCFRFSNDT